MSSTPMRRRATARESATGGRRGPELQGRVPAPRRRLRGRSHCNRFPEPSKFAQHSAPGPSARLAVGPSPKPSPGEKRGVLSPYSSQYTADGIVSRLVFRPASALASHTASRRLRLDDAQQNRDCFLPGPPPASNSKIKLSRNLLPQPQSFRDRIQIRATLNLIVEFDLKFLPVPVTAYSQTSTLRSR